MNSGGSGIGGLIAALVVLVVIVFYLGASWRVFSKAGRPGWLSIIPIVNTVVLLHIVGRPWWWVLLLFVPIVDFVILVLVFYDLARSYGHGAGFFLGLFFLSFIFYPILGYGGSRYRGPAARVAL